VQNLADEANALGARIQVDGTDQWIGSPLRVHRRCVDPMFTIANQIAYRGKMIYFDQHDPALRLPPSDSVDVGPSAWVDIGGMAQDRQAVPEQIELVCRAIVELSVRTGGLPALYVISPFRRIKDAVARRLATVDWPAGSRPSQRTLRDWCRTRIGTVHTFQGKEESMVWMVLGCDAQTRAAAGWAAGKPNLFNVALTRAKHRFFLIGDAGLWGGLSHFADASPALLPRIRPDVFLRRIGAGSAGAAAAPAGTCVDG
jgi:superfamily I DNA and/or RNA helicase